MWRVWTAALLLAGLPWGTARAADLLPDPERLEAPVAATVHLEERVPAGEPGVWNPRALREAAEEKLMSVLPGSLEAVARTFVDRRLSIDLSHDRAFVKLRLRI